MILLVAVLSSILLVADPQPGLIDVDSLLFIEDSLQHGGKPWAIPTVSTSTAFAIGGRFELVDTLRVHVTSSVEPDTVAGIYKYTYILRNLPSSQEQIEWFELWGITDEIASPTSPANWELLSLPTPTDRRIVWAVTADDPPPPGWVDDGVSLYPSAHGIAPGDTLSGFGFVSRHRSGSISFRVVAFEQIPVVENPEELRIPHYPFQAAGTVDGPRAEDQNQEE